MCQSQNTLFSPQLPPPTSAMLVAALRYGRTCCGDIFFSKEMRTCAIDDVVKPTDRAVNRGFTAPTTYSQTSLQNLHQKKQFLKIPKLYFNTGKTNASIYIIAAFTVIVTINNSGIIIDSIGKSSRLSYDMTSEFSLVFVFAYRMTVRSRTFVVHPMIK